MSAYSFQITSVSLANGLLQFQASLGQTESIQGYLDVQDGSMTITHENGLTVAPYEVSDVGDFVSLWYNVNNVQVDSITTFVESVRQAGWTIVPNSNAPHVIPGTSITDYISYWVQCPIVGNEVTGHPYHLVYIRYDLATGSITMYEGGQILGTYTSVEAAREAGMARQFQGILAPPAMQIGQHTSDYRIGWELGSFTYRASGTIADVTLFYRDHTHQTATAADGLTVAGEWNVATNVFTFSTLPALTLTTLDQLHEVISQSIQYGEGFDRPGPRWRMVNRQVDLSGNLDFQIEITGAAGLLDGSFNLATGALTVDGIEYDSWNTFDWCVVQMASGHLNEFSSTRSGTDLLIEFTLDETEYTGTIDTTTHVVYIDGTAYGTMWIFQSHVDVGWTFVHPMTWFIHEGYLFSSFQVTLNGNTIWIQVTPEDGYCLVDFKPPFDPYLNGL
jgi:hypothetical protein